METVKGLPDPGMENKAVDLTILLVYYGPGPEGTQEQHSKEGFVSLRLRSGDITRSLIFMRDGCSLCGWGWVGRQNPHTKRDALYSR